MVTGEVDAGGEGAGTIIGGTLNQQGSFVMRAESVGPDTVLARIVDMVAKAQRSRAPIQRLGHRGGLVRAGGNRRCGAGVHRLVDLRDRRPRWPTG